MDLIYADTNKKDIGVLLDYQFDLAFGYDENNFELTVSRKNYCCDSGYYIYIEGTEYGGIIDTIAVDTEEENVVYKGRTWQGILEGKIISPDSGQDYYTVTGTAYQCIEAVLAKLGLAEHFQVEHETFSTSIDYQFERYVDGYKGIRKMLASVNLRPKFSYKYGRVVITAESIQRKSFDSDQIALNVTKVYTTTNHMICLGQGELKDRQVIHLYADINGNISKNQSITGINEIVGVYDYPSAASLADLEKGGIEQLSKAIDGSTISLSFDAGSNNYEVGDIISGKDVVTGISATAAITKKIVTIDKGYVNIEYKVGEE